MYTRSAEQGFTAITYLVQLDQAHEAHDILKQLVVKAIVLMNDPGIRLGEFQA